MLHLWLPRPGSPAHAGMDLVAGPVADGVRWLPRPRGDGPLRLAGHDHLESAPPPTRGWTGDRPDVWASHGFVDTGLGCQLASGSILGLELDRGLVAERRVQAPAVVEGLDVFEDGVADVDGIGPSRPVRIPRIVITQIAAS